MNASKHLGLFTVSGLVVANMIGAGVFTTSGFAVGDLGSPAWVMLAWFVGGLIAICGALSYGLLARQIPESGGEYLFLSRNIHPLVGFVAGWVSLLAGFTGAIAYAAMTFEAYIFPVETSNAKINVPRSMLIGTVLVIVIYLCLNAVFVYALPPSLMANQQDIAILVAQNYMGIYLKTLSGWLF